jgi:hypothetical protein
MEVLFCNFVIILLYKFLSNTVCVILNIHALTTVVVKMFYIVKFQEWNYSAWSINHTSILNKLPVKDSLCVYAHLLHGCINTHTHTHPFSVMICYES